MTLLQHLNDVSIERGFRDFRHLTDDGLVYVVEDIIEEAGKRYATGCIKASLEEASYNSDWGVFQNDDGQEPFHHQDNIFVNKESITNENNIILL